MHGDPMACMAVYRRLIAKCTNTSAVKRKQTCRLCKKDAPLPVGFKGESGSPAHRRRLPQKGGQDGEMEGKSTRAAGAACHGPAIDPCGPPTLTLREGRGWMEGWAFGRRVTNDLQARVCRPAHNPTHPALRGRASARGRETNAALKLTGAQGVSPSVFKQTALQLY